MRIWFHYENVKKILTMISELIWSAIIIGSGVKLIKLISFEIRPIVYNLLRNFT